jgi:uncharacterized delta-60 repeat protein
MSWVYKTGIDMPRTILNNRKKIAILSLFIVASSLFSIPSASAAVGDLDTSFDADGKLNTAIGALSSIAKSVALQSDGKIVVAGYAYDGSFDFAVVRYNTDGSLDTSFDTDGKVTTDIGGSTDVANSIAVQSDGKIVVAGYAYISNNIDFAVVRYNTDGSLDSSFDTDGKVTTAIGSLEDAAKSVALQSDGKIVVAGHSWSGSKYNFAVVRYNTDGSLDTSFDTDGKVTTAIGSQDDIANSIALQSDGKIVVAGYKYTSGIYNFAVVRYNTDGSLDTSFDTDGKVTAAFDGSANSIALQSDGKIVVAGYSYDGSDSDFAVVRYNTDGSLDTSFDTDGKVTTAIGSATDFAYSIAVQSDGKIVVAGKASISGNTDFAVVRYNTNGSLDTSFSTDGKVTAAIGDSTDVGYSIALQSDGKIVVAGSAGISMMASNFGVVRYIASDSAVPSAPTLTSVTSGDRRVTIAFTAGANNGAAITDYEYSLNGGVYTSAGTTTSPFTITGLSGRTAYSVTIKARNSVGLSTASASLSATTTDASLDASEAAATEAARVAEVARLAAVEAARVAEVARLAAIESARVAAEAEAAKKAKEQKELTELLSVIPSIAGLALNLGDLTNSLLATTCVKGKTVKSVKKGAKCPKGFVKKK